MKKLKRIFSALVSDLGAESRFMISTYVMQYEQNVYHSKREKRIGVHLFTKIIEKSCFLFIHPFLYLFSCVVFFYL